MPLATGLDNDWSGQPCEGDQKAAKPTRDHGRRRSKTIYLFFFLRAREFLGQVSLYILQYTSRLSPGLG